jgi:hypothetical protein
VARELEERLERSETVQQLGHPYGQRREVDAKAALPVG